MTDRGGEYMDTLYFQSFGIIHETTAPYTLQKMGSCKNPDPKLKTLGERGIECIFVEYVEHSKTFRFSSVSKPSQRSLINRTEDIGGSVVPEEVVTQQPKPDLRKGKKNRTPKNFRPEFQ
ncbi:hypothetical protein Tco_1079704 [Tanacetum coccineum]|uniref:Uncharacterized protein n=1 Tax=Tanacetum coccineum TaxID=301880 RepID=A0ABQ5HTI9_9ASTR